MNQTNSAIVEMNTTQLMIFVKNPSMQVSSPFTVKIRPNIGMITANITIF